MMAVKLHSPAWSSWLFSRCFLAGQGSHLWNFPFFLGCDIGCWEDAKTEEFLREEGKDILGGKGEG